ncbi:MAG TPA: hypothetical protein EYN67_08145 [Flavobacteriales bacterium]|nr:hypothetical protein [Flavobacteriales bacterium]
MSQGRGVIGCCDKSATNYDAEARTCCRDCCTYAGNGNGTQTIYASATKPNDGGNWMQYTTKFQSSGNCSSGGKTYPMKIMPGKVWVKQPPNNPNMVMVAMAHPQCSVMGNPKYMSDGRSRFEEIADQGGNGTGNGGNGANGTYLRTAGFDFGKYKYYIIGAIVIIGYLWYTGKLKKLMPKR